MTAPLKIGNLKPLTALTTSQLLRFVKTSQPLRFVTHWKAPHRAKDDVTKLLTLYIDRDTAQFHRQTRGRFIGPPQIEGKWFVSPAHGGARHLPGIFFGLWSVWIYFGAFGSTNLSTPLAPAVKKFYSTLCQIPPLSPPIPGTSPTTATSCAWLTGPPHSGARSAPSRQLPVDRTADFSTTSSNRARIYQFRQFAYVFP